jgi:glycerol-3-phosphate cytidylyltransferase
MFLMQIGFVAGSFDVIHPGYMYMFRKSKQYCDYLVVALQLDPSIERPQKHKPVLTYKERESILYGIRYIDEVIPYNSEDDLIKILKKERYHVRILGEDYKEKYATGQELSEKIVYMDRSHGWSTTKYKKLLCESLHGENK